MSSSPVIATSNSDDQLPDRNSEAKPNPNTTHKTADQSNVSAHGPHHSANALLIIALGLVYGDIGTSPLYAFQLTLKAIGHASPTPADALGVASLILWSLLVTIGVKYCLLVLRADNHGEGGIMALASLIANGGHERIKFWGLGLVTILGIIGSALLFGDGVITPAISVLSAMEGIKVLAPDFEHLVLPVTMVLLVALFMVQRFGSGKIGGAFGPIMLVWFLSIALIGLSRIIETPEVLLAVNPLYAYNLLVNNPGTASTIFGAVFLALTGGEAMYADMGHVGALAIRKAFFYIVLPSLLINYFGQAALIMSTPEAADNTFYKAAASWALAPMIMLAAAATIIASQALISGVFSLTRQAIQFDLLPKMLVKQTSSHEFGQIYVPAMNWLLSVGTLLVVLTFKSSDALGAAYGVAVSGTMLITTLLLSRAMVTNWGWSPLYSLLTVAFFGSIDLGFFASNSVKIAEGGWLPLSIGLVLAFMMISWRQGTMAVRYELAKFSKPLPEFLTDIKAKVDGGEIVRVPGLACWLTKVPVRDEGVGPLLLRHLDHNKCIHQHVVLFSVNTARKPYVRGKEHFEFQVLGQGFYRVKFTVGFMQTANVHAAMRLEIGALAHIGVLPTGLEHDLHFFIAHENLRRKEKEAALNWFTWTMFLLMKKFSARSTDFFELPHKMTEERGIFLTV